MENELVKFIKNLNLDNLETVDKEELLRIFNIVKNADLRNQIALIFSGLKYNEAVPSIIKKITDKGLVNNTGTLVFSLYDLEAKKYFVTLVKVLCEHEYEARLMAFEIVEKYAKAISSRIRKKSLEILEAHRAEKEKSYTKADYVNSALNFIDQTIKLLKDG